MLFMSTVIKALESMMGRYATKTPDLVVDIIAASWTRSSSILISCLKRALLALSVPRKQCRFCDQSDGSFMTKATPDPYRRQKEWTMNLDHNGPAKSPSYLCSQTASAARNIICLSIDRALSFMQV